MDDVIIFSKNFDDHLVHISKVFDRLQKAGLKLKLTKCLFGHTSVLYLGHIVSRDGVSPDPSKLEAINKFPVPKNVSELKSFLGLAGYYRKFVQNYSAIVHDLTQLTKKNIDFQWTEKQDLVFNKLKMLLTTAPILRYPNFARPFIIHTDASGYGIGSVLAQVQFDKESNSEVEVVLGYASKHLSAAEMKWPIIEKEAFAIIHAVKFFHPYLYGRKFKVVTDHRPLEWLMKKRDSTGRLARWSLKLQEYDMEIAYRPGVTNQKADCLSRSPISKISFDSLGTPTIGLITKEWVAEQLKDINCQEKEKFISSEKNRQGIVRLENGLLGTQEGKILVPKILRESVLENFHDHKTAGHLGIAKTLAKIRNRFKWPKMRKDIHNFIRSCLICAKRKPHGKTKAPLQPLPITDFVFERVALDIVGPVHPSLNNNVYILVMSEYKTRYIETAAMSDQTAATVARQFIEKIILRHGVPHQLLSDQGSNFMSELFTSLCSQLGIKKIRTTAYNPKCDGLVEKFNATLGNMLTSYVSSDPSQWDIYLPYVTHAYNCSIHATLGETPFFLLYGRDAVEPHDLLPPSRYRLTTNEVGLFSDHWHRAMQLADANLLKVQHRMKKYYDKQTTVKSYSVGDFVLLREMTQGGGKFTFRWSGPFSIVRKLNELNYAIRSDSKPTPVVVNVNRLKAFTPREPISKDDPVTPEPIKQLPRKETVKTPSNEKQPESIEPKRYNLRQKICLPAKLRQ